MHCAACAANIERALRRVEGVSDAGVNLATEEAAVTFDDTRLIYQDIIAAVESVGYGAAAPSAADEQEAAGLREVSDLHQRLIVAASATALILLITHLFPFPRAVQPWVLLALATPVQFWAGAQFYRGTWIAGRSGFTDMNTLIVVGTSAAYGYSLAATIAPEALARAGAERHLYYDTAAMIMTLILLGRTLEARAKGRASEAIRRLIGLQPKTARVLRDAEETEIQIEEVVVDDIVLVRPGERLPVDGIVVEGRSAVDESMVTGESMPVDKAPDDAVIGGTINQSGAFRFRASRVGSDTVLAQIIRLVREAQASKAPIQRLADRVAGIFVPAVIIIAAITFFGWLVLGLNLAYAVVAGVSVLIIACPCALGLATPTSLLVGTGKGAELGILIRSAEALEAAGGVDTVAFDKTGTLTRGEPEVTDIAPAKGRTQEEVLLLAASVERESEHPLGQAVLRAAQERGIAPNEVEEFQASPGLGVRGRVGNQQIAAGTPKLMQDLGVDTAPIPDRAAALAADGKTVILVAADGTAIGALALADVPRPEAADAIRLLTEMRLAVVMLTGDNARTAHAVAQSVGIDQVRAELLPDQKTDAVRDLQQAGRRVAMVGDGINDAPALAQADLGIAIGRGTDIAVEAADIALVRDDLRLIPEAVRLSRATRRNIKQNLFWAFFYNTVSIPIAAGLFYSIIHTLLHPALAAAAMAFSSVSVIANALRLKSYRPLSAP